MTFDFSIQGYNRDNNYRVWLDNNTLRVDQILYGKNVPLEKEIFVNQNEFWKDLLQFLHTCQWDEKYESYVLDGTQWELKIKGDGIKIKSYGSNNYPPDFQEFLSRLNALLKPTGVIIN